MEMSSFFSRRFGFNRSRKKDIPGGLWSKCPSCAEMLYQEDLIKNLQVCASCGHHFPMDRELRIAMFCDPESFVEWDAGMVSEDPLQFTGTDSYVAKLKKNQEKTGYGDAVSIGKAAIEGMPVGFGVMDFSFLVMVLGIHTITGIRQEVISFLINQKSDQLLIWVHRMHCP